MSSLSHPNSKPIARAAAAAVALLALLSLVAAQSFAQTAGPVGPTRAEYIAQADPVCKATFHNRLPKTHGKDDIKGFIHVFRAMGGQIGHMADKLDRIPKPPADAPALTNWLKSLHGWSHASLAAASALKHRNAHAFRASIARMNRAQKIRRMVVKSFGFRVCG